MMDEASEFVKYLHERVQVGQCLQVDRHQIERMFGAGMFEGLIDHANGPIDRLMGRLMGSAWGCWTITQRIEDGNYVVCRHNEGDKRVWEYPDRR